MNSITVEGALLFAEQNFPKAPENLIGHLEIDVQYSSINCDGWCLQLGDKAIIRINKGMPDVRKRFTLAHELGHLILGIPTIIGESIFEGTNKKSIEERRVDELAAQLLLPKSTVLNEIKEIPVTAAVLKKIAKRAEVSEVTVALRVASLASDLGLSNASAIFYESDEVKWQWPKTLKIPKPLAREILSKCAEVTPAPARIPHQQSMVIVASLLKNIYLNTKVIFLQLVTEAEGLRQLPEERIRELEKYVYKDDNDFRRSLQGCFGAFKPEVQTLSLEEAEIKFYGRYSRDQARWGVESLERLKSEKGREYVRLRLQMWSKN